MTIEPLRPGCDVPTDVTRIHALSFGQAADLYNTARPTYPAEAIDWAFGDKARTILDVGAGTGLLSRALHSAGHHVIAIDPDKQMLEKLTSASTGISQALHAGAEDIPLPNNSVDAITAGQSYHWFDPEQALPEFARVIRPGGTFSPIWNVRDESVDWVRRLSQIVGSSAAEYTAQCAKRPGYFAPYFPEHILKIFPHQKPLTPTGLVRLVKSRSYYLTVDNERKTEILDEVHELIKTHPGLKGRDTFAMPYQTYVYQMKPR